MPPTTWSKAIATLGTVALVVSSAVWLMGAVFGAMATDGCTQGSEALVCAPGGATRLMAFLAGIAIIGAIAGTAGAWRERTTAVQQSIAPWLAVVLQYAAVKGLAAWMDAPII